MLKSIGQCKIRLFELLALKWFLTQFDPSVETDDTISQSTLFAKSLMKYPGSDSKLSEAGKAELLSHDVKILSFSDQLLKCSPQSDLA